MRTDPLFSALNGHLVLFTLEKTLVLVGLLYLFSRARFFSSLLLARGTRRDKVYVLLLFAGFAIVGGERHGIRSLLFDPRIITACAGGLLAGPWVGAGVGLVSSAVHVWLHGWRLSHLGLASIGGGLLCGIVSVYRPRPIIRMAAGFVVSMFAVMVQLGLRIFEEGSQITLTAVGFIALPVTLIHAAGVCALLYIVEDLKRRREMVAREEIHLALRIVSDSLTPVRHGLDNEAAAHIADVVRHLAGVDAVALTNRDFVMAHRGAGEDHHRPGDAVETPAIQRVLRTGQPEQVDALGSPLCAHPRCPLRHAVIAPLMDEEKLTGTIILYGAQVSELTADTVELAIGFAQFLSTYLTQRRDLERQTRLAASAELKVLQAKMHPHFLFNALSTALGLMRTRPEEARDVMVRLSQFLRTSLQQSDRLLVSLEEEMETVRTYLAIEQARFGKRLLVVEEIDPAALDSEIPPLTLQTLVENAVVHGLSPKVGGGTLRLEARQRDQYVWFWVIDDGVGMSAEVRRRALYGNGSESHGLSIVQERLRRLYGDDCRFSVSSREGEGTTVAFALPCPPAERAVTSDEVREQTV